MAIAILAFNYGSNVLDGEWKALLIFRMPAKEDGG